MCISYCEDNKLGSWISVLRETEDIKATTMDFLLWICEKEAVKSYGNT